jgi:hypothetical protein
MTVPLLCPYDSVFVSILQHTALNVFNQPWPISTLQYALNAIVVLDVVGSNPTSRPRIKAFTELLAPQTFAPIKNQHLLNNQSP